MKMRFSRRKILGASAAWAMISNQAASQVSYPDRPIRIIVPFPPGGSNDIMGRVMAQELSTALNQRVIVENRTGAGGTIGVSAVARAPGDGYTLLLISLYFAVNPALYQTLPYDPVAGFKTVSVVASGPLVLLAHPSTNIRSLEELVRRAKAAPDSLRYSSAGNGSAQHLSMEYFKQTAGVDISHIPYRGGGETMTDVIAGRVELSMSSLAQSVNVINDGSMMPLGVTSLNRSSVIPLVPAIAEVYPGFDAVTWWGLSAQATVPQPIMDRLHAALAVGLGSDVVKKRLVSEGAEPMTLSTAQSDTFVSSEMRKWSEITQRAGIKPQ
jgi:tripartite-type tricarboxylate transporter receptor subunit TctC